MWIALEQLEHNLYKMNAAREKKSRHGQSLIEVLLSLSIAAIVLGAMTIAVISSLRNAQFAKNQNLATQLASQGMEIIKEIRDRDASLEGHRGTWCLEANGSFTALPCDQNVGTVEIGVAGPPYLYSRSVKILESHLECTTDTYYVEISVSWWDNACDDPGNFCHKVQVASCLVKQIGIPPSASL